MLPIREFFYFFLFKILTNSILCGGILAFLKLNYSQGYTHFLDQTEEGLYNQFILHQAILPNKTQKVDEGVIINLLSYDFQLLEKRYQFSGEKKAYFSTEFIAQVPSLSLEENVKAIKKVASKIGSEFADEDYQVVAKVKQAIVESIDQNGYIEPKEIAAVYLMLSTSKIFTGSIVTADGGYSLLNR